MWFLLSIPFIIFLSFITLVVIVLCCKLYSIVTKRTCSCKTRLDGKVVLITGGNSGIGLETARELARRGARVVIASRDQRKSSAVVADIITSTGNEHVEHMYLDLASFSNVREFAEQFNNSYDRLDILVNNAGCGGLKHRITKDGINIVMQINYFGPFLLTNLLLKKLIESKPSRIVIVSSLAHILEKFDVEDIKGHKELHYVRTYSNSKLCNLLWAKALATKLPDSVTVNALHPGVVKTNLFNRLGPTAEKICLFLIGNLFKTAVEGAQTSIHLCLSEKLNNKSGGYYSECARSKESALANNQELIDKVWCKSCLITNSTVPNSPGQQW